MLSGTLTVSSVDPVSGEAVPSGELVTPGVRGGLPLASARGESIASRDPALATRIVDELHRLDAEHGAPVRVRYEIANGIETRVAIEAAVLSPTALVRVLVERVRDARLTRAAAIDRITAAELEAAGTFVLSTSEVPVARGLAASAGAASGRASLPGDFDESGEPRVLIVDDASPEDAAAIRACVAIVATSGGLTADAAIAARALRKPCVVSTPLRLGHPNQPKRGDWITVDGSSGCVHLGALPTTWTPTTPFAAELAGWLAIAADERPGQALVRARNAVSQGDHDP